MDITPNATTFAALTKARMIAAWLACDRAYDGRFLVGVKTTGIYCLPSCRTPRQPKRENVVFLATPEAARAVGLRPCKLCRPDDFYRGHRPEEDLVEGLVAAVTRDPGAYRGVNALASAAGVSASKLHTLFRAYYQATPAEVLGRARIAAAREALLHGRRPVAEIAYAVGFESLSAFNETFRKRSAMCPLDYRRLAERPEFVVALPVGYPVARMLRALGDGSRRGTERVAGRTYSVAFRPTGEDGRRPSMVSRVEFLPGAARCRVETAGTVADPAVLGQAHERLLAALGLTTDPTRFEALVAATPGLAPLIAGQRGLRLSLVADPFDGLVRAITDRQGTPTPAAALRRRLVERVGVTAGDGLFAPPAPAAVATLEPSDLAALGFPRMTAGYLVDAARAIVDGRLDVDALAGGSATRAERTLLAVDGIGPGSAQILMMRSFGFLDCTPPGDARLMAGLARFFALDRRPNPREILALMHRFRPYRSLATAHLWTWGASAPPTEAPRPVPVGGEAAGAAAD